MVSDEEDSDKDEMNEERERDALADELFDGEADDSEAPRERVANEFDSLDVDEEEDEDGKNKNRSNFVWSFSLIYLNKDNKTQNFLKFSLNVLRVLCTRMYVQFENKKILNSLYRHG